MPGRVLTTPEADADLADAFDWYEKLRSGLGAAFLAEVAVVLSHLESYPEAHAIIRGETRRAIVHRFPYGVFYVVDPDLTSVTGVLHFRRDPVAVP
jgi:plasmid stabilization system protein ParE